MASGQGVFDVAAAGARGSVEPTLSRLKTDYLNNYPLHSYGNDSEALSPPALEVLDHVEKRDYSRAIGIGSETVAGGLKARALQFAIAMSIFNLI